MRTCLLTALLAIVGFGCGPKVDSKVPSYVLSEEKMVEVMVDMHIVETALNLKIMTPDSNNTEYDQRFASIFVSNDIRKEQFDSSLFYYSTRTGEMNKIYDKVLERLSELESEVNSDQ
jgi:hypothetical protein